MLHGLYWLDIVVFSVFVKKEQIRYVGLTEMKVVGIVVWAFFDESSRHSGLSIFCYPDLKGLLTQDSVDKVTWVLDLCTQSLACTNVWNDMHFNARQHLTAFTWLQWKETVMYIEILGDDVSSCVHVQETEAVFIIALWKCYWELWKRLLINCGMKVSSQCELVICYLWQEKVHDSKFLCVSFVHAATVKACKLLSQTDALVPTVWV